MEKDKSFVHRAFWVSLFVKGIDGALQLAGGIIALVVEPGTLGRAYRYLTRFLLGSNTHNVEAAFIKDAAQQFNMSVEILVSIYLLTHGVIKVLLVYGLLKERLWVFPAAFVGFGFFLAVEIYRIVHHFYWGIMILMCIDVFVITMVWLEYKKVKRQSLSTAAN
jgi:uncharacterized membrane protein